MSDQVKYTISSYPTRNVIARHKTPAKNRPFSEIISYLTMLSEGTWELINEKKKYMYANFPELENAFYNYFTLHLIYSIILERICLECRLNNQERVNRGLGKIRIQGRCKEFKEFPCKMHYVTDKVFDLLGY